MFWLPGCCYATCRAFGKFSVIWDHNIRFNTSIRFYRLIFQLSDIIFALAYFYHTQSTDHAFEFIIHQSSTIKQISCTTRATLLDLVRTWTSFVFSTRRCSALYLLRLSVSSNFEWGELQVGYFDWREILTFCFKSVLVWNFCTFLYISAQSYHSSCQILFGG